MLRVGSVSRRETASNNGTTLIIFIGVYGRVAARSTAVRVRSIVYVNT